MDQHAKHSAQVESLCGQAYISNQRSASSAGRAVVTVVNETEDFEAWFECLDRRDQEAVERVVWLLKMRGVTLGQPSSSALRGSRFSLRELRPKRGASPLRVLYAFDPRREALLLLGGSKAKEPSFYRRAIVRAEALWEQHLQNLTR